MNQRLTVCPEGNSTLQALYEVSPISLYIHRSTYHKYAIPDSPVYPVTHHHRQCTVALNCIKGPVYIEAHPVDRDCDYIVEA